MDTHALFVGATDRLGRGLARTGLAPRLRGADDARLVFYHGIGDNSAPCLRWLVDELDEASFERQLDHLAARYELVSMDEVVDGYDAPRPAGATRRRPPCAISFDDGLSTVYSKAFPLLAARRIPFTVYLNTAVIDNADLLWQHRLGYLVSTLGRDATVRALEDAFDGAHPPVPDEIGARGLERWCRDRSGALHALGAFDRAFDALGLDAAAVAREQRLYLTVEEIGEMHAAGASFHSHTHAHLALGTVDDEAVVREQFERAFATLSGGAPFGTRFASLPYGAPDQYGAGAVDAARRAGHEWIVEVGDGLNPPARVRARRLFARVNLGRVEAAPGALYSALELRPGIKAMLGRGSPGRPAPAREVGPA